MKTGQLTPAEFVLAGDYLVENYMSWQWVAGEAGKLRKDLPPDKQYVSSLLCFSAVRTPWTVPACLPACLPTQSICSNICRSSSKRPCQVAVLVARVRAVAPAFRIFSSNSCKPRGSNCIRCNADEPRFAT